jgi:hypothetical protein
MPTRTAVLALAAAALMATAASPASAAEPQPRSGLTRPPQSLAKQPPLPKGARPAKRHGVRARSATFNLTYDAKVNCYPWTGGVVGGGSDNNSVASTLWWSTRDGRTYPAYHQFVLENWVNGTSFWVTRDGSAFPGPFLDRPGGYHVGPNGVQEWTQYFSGYGEGGGATMTPWGWEQGFMKSIRSYVRGWVKLWVYTPEAGWEQTSWRLATVQGDSMQVPGWCSM